MEFYGFDFSWQCDQYTTTTTTTTTSTTRTTTTTTTTTTTNFGMRLADWQSELGYNLYTVSGSCGYLLQLTLEALALLKDRKLYDDSSVKRPVQPRLQPLKV